MSDKPLSLSVVVPAYDAAQKIARCIEGLEKQSAPRGSYEIVVVDDGSTDKTGEVAASSGARVVSQPHRGPGAARNLGAENAHGDVVLFLDADCEPAPNWIDAMVRPFSDSTIAGVCGEKKTRQKNIWARFIQVEFDYRYERVAARRRTDFVDSGTAAYRRQVFLANGGFDTSLEEAEDAEFSFRLAESGYVMVLAPDAVVYHNHPESLGAYLRRKLQYARWRAVVYAMHPRKAAKDTRTPQTQKLQAALAFAIILAALAALVRIEWAWAALLLLALFLLTTLPILRRGWKTSPPIALVAPVALLLAAYATVAGTLLGITRRRAPAPRRALWDPGIDEASERTEGP